MKANKAFFGKLYYVHEALPSTRITLQPNESIEPL